MDEFRKGDSVEVYGLEAVPFGSVMEFDKIVGYLGGPGRTLAVWFSHSVRLHGVLTRRQRRNLQTWLNRNRESPSLGRFSVAWSKHVAVTQAQFDRIVWQDLFAALYAPGHVSVEKYEKAKVPHPSPTNMELYE